MAKTGTFLSVPENQEGKSPRVVDEYRPLPVAGGVGDLVFDAWGRQKVVNDFSLFHGMYTFDVPDSMWIEYNDSVETYPKTSALSVDGELVLDSNGGTALLMSKRHPRYQPNRGMLYSSSMFFPNKTADAIRDAGVFTSGSGAFFRLKSDGLLYACRRSTTTAGGTVEDEELITMPDSFVGFDVEKGNIYDIQMQWRGVGNLKFFIGNPNTGVSELVHVMDVLGTLDNLSMRNPAMPIAFQVENTTEDAVIKCGCVDATSEGGVKENRQYNSLDSEEVNLTTSELPILTLHVKDEINSRMNTRDLIFNRVTGFSEVNSLIRLYYTRTAAAFTGTTWTDASVLGNTEYSVDGNITVNTGLMRKLTTRRIPAAGSLEITNPDQDNGEFYLTHGDYILVTMEAKNNTTGGATIEYGEEV